ncbi:MAG: NAD(P)H-dependent oxidoreductase subunit E, partial [Planctomycetes bacterium]|nr:NAD(P)H-dependent oxidoreductase subunit E [Planctomycetota bacterium]
MPDPKPSKPSKATLATVKRAVHAVDGDPTRLLDVVRQVQEDLGCVDDATVMAIAKLLGLAPVEVEGLVSFYAFFAKEKLGQIVVRLCNAVVDRLAGFEGVGGG